MTDAPKLLLGHHLKTLKLPTFLREYDKLARQCATEGLTGALASTELAPAPDITLDHGLPWHSGSIDFLQGRPEPGDD